MKYEFSIIGSILFYSVMSFLAIVFMYFAEKSSIDKPKCKLLVLSIVFC